MRGDGARLIQAYIGDGKGKTTAAIGQSLRTAGHGYHVLFLQFLKNVHETSGELTSINCITTIHHAAFGTGKFIKMGEAGDLDRGYAGDAINYATAQAGNHAMDMLVLEEIGAALELDLIEADQVLRIFEIGSGWLDIILTGRTLPEIILERADLVTEMKLVRHHYDTGVPARAGIEY